MKLGEFYFFTFYLKLAVKGLNKKKCAYKNKHSTIKDAANGSACVRNFTDLKFFMNEFLELIKFYFNPMLVFKRIYCVIPPCHSLISLRNKSGRVSIYGSVKLSVIYCLVRL